MKATEIMCDNDPLGRGPEIYPNILMSVMRHENLILLSFESHSL